LTDSIDTDEEIIAFAKQEYDTLKTQFFNVDLREWVSDTKIDMLFSVETIEHIENRHALPDFCDRNSVNRVILTYPSKKTTHYNPYHLYDFKLQDIIDIFDKFICYRHFNWEYEFDVVFLTRKF
jgi:hypothetical protein